MRVFKILLLIIISSGMTMAGTEVDSVLDFQWNIRHEISIDDGPLLPDSELNIIIQRALLFTSTDCGGVFAHVKITLVDGQAFYAMPDTVVTILSATLMSDEQTFSLVRYPLAVTEDILPTELEIGEDRPGAYSYWPDTVQIVPYPQNPDSVFFKVFVEHPAVDNDTNTIFLKSPFIEAAHDYAMYLVNKQIKDYETAAWYEGEYQKKRAVLRQQYWPKYDIGGQ